MKRKILVLSLMFAGSIAFAQTKTINFETTPFAVIKAKAKIENKLIFIDAYTAWCGPCKWMAKNIFTNDTVADFFNKEFVNAQFDMEKGEGIELRKLYNVNCFPNLLFIDGDGKLVHRAAGSCEAKDFIQLAKDVSDPKKRFSKYMDEYAAKKTDPTFLVEYINAISKTCLKPDEILVDYFKTQKNEELSNRINWNMIRDYSSNYKSWEFTYLLNNLEKYNKAYTADSVNSKIVAVFMQGGFAAIYNKDAKDNDYKAYLEEIKKINFTAFDEVSFRLEMAYLQKKEDWKKYIQLIVEKGDIYFHLASDFNNYSWAIYEHSDDNAALLKAEKWMQKAVLKEQNGPYYDTQAAILYKLNKKQEAKAAALKSIELAKADGATEEDYKETSDLLEKIEKLK